MPSAEFTGILAKGKVDSTQQETPTSSNDIFSYGTENDCVELVWENGQIMMQGQSSRAKKGPILSNSLSLKPQDGKNASNSRTANKMAMVDSMLNDFPLSAPSSEIELDQDDDMVPWLNYPLDEQLHDDYTSDFLPELSGVTLNDIHTERNLGSIGKINSFNGDIHTNPVFNTSPVIRANEVAQLPRPGKPNVSSDYSANFHHFVCRDSVPGPSSMGDSSSMKMQKQDSGQPSTSSGFLNFSHFSRPALLARANLRSLNNNERLVNVDKGGDLSCTNPAESTLVNLSSLYSPKERDSHTQHIMGPTGVNRDSSSYKPIEVTNCEDQAMCIGDTNRNDKSPSQGLCGTVPKNGEKVGEPAVATSSVCSGNSVERASNDPTRDLKRKYIDTGESEGPSEEVEEESVDVRKSAPARTGSKRSRAAEVHNLSERRRRDRINEKMRALQELIPNCNKVDKASMLDEAIEYLKTLQLQVQILSMGAGLYMQPMMVPPGMQHIHGPHFPHFSPMPMGMGLRMGFGMNMLDVNGGMMQAPPFQVPRYPVPTPSIAGSPAFPGMMGPGIPGFPHPGQGLPMSMPHPSLIPVPGAPPPRLPTGLSVSGVSASADLQHCGPSCRVKDHVQNVGVQVTPNNDVNQASNQLQATNKGLEPSSSKQGQGRDVNVREGSNSTSGTEIAPS